MWTEKLKLSKQLVRSVIEAGYLAPKEIQIKTLSRIIGGQDIIAVGPEGSGKTTAYILGVLTRLKYGFEEAPRALILVPDKESVLKVIEQFELLNKNPTIRVVGLYAAPGMETQLNALADGADIVVATPDRARAIYLKLGLNMNKIILFVVDDADQIVKQGLQLPVAELANSIIKCQHLVFTEVVHSKLSQMIQPFMNMPALIEADELGEAKTEVHEQVLYHVPNFRTKLNLLNLLINDKEIFTKAVVFVNTRLTAEKLYENIHRYMREDAVAILNPVFFESTGFETIEDFKDQTNVRVLIVANELQKPVDTRNIPFLIHFELPEEKETYIGRMIRRADDETETMAITFTTDLELGMVRKIEQAIGQKLKETPLPADLVIVNELKTVDKIKKTIPAKTNSVSQGEAFHEKKESNRKDYNYSAGTKAKMNKKKKH